MPHGHVHVLHDVKSHDIRVARFGTINGQMQQKFEGA